MELLNCTSLPLKITFTTFTILRYKDFGFTKALLDEINSNNDYNDYNDDALRCYIVDRRNHGSTF